MNSSASSEEKNTRSQNKKQVKELSVSQFNFSFKFVHVLKNKVHNKDLLTEWCFMPISSYFSYIMATAHIVHVFSWVSPVLCWGSEMSCPRTLQQQAKRNQCGSNPGPLDYKYNT